MVSAAVCTVKGIEEFRAKVIDLDIRDSDSDHAVIDLQEYHREAPDLPVCRWPQESSK